MHSFDVLWDYLSELAKWRNASLLQKACDVCICFPIMPRKIGSSWIINKILMIFKDMKMYGHLNMDTSEALLQNIINFEEKKRKKKKKEVCGIIWNYYHLAVNSVFRKTLVGTELGFEHRGAKHEPKKFQVTWSIKKKSWYTKQLHFITINI